MVAAVGLPFFIILLTRRRRTAGRAAACGRDSAVRHRGGPGPLVVLNRRGAPPLFLCSSPRFRSANAASLICPQVKARAGRDVKNALPQPKRKGCPAGGLKKKRRSRVAWCAQEVDALMAHLASCALRCCVGVDSVLAAPSWYTTWADVARAVASVTVGPQRWDKSQCSAKIKSMNAARLAHVSGEVRQRKKKCD